MMLRTTISRIKKVCTVAFVPRLLRGEPRCAPGKFEIFSYAVLRKAPKCTKSTDGGENAKKTEQDEGADFIYACKEEPGLEDKRVEVANLGDETAKESINPLVSPRVPLKETHCEKCQRIIDQAFGKDEFVEPMLGEQYFSHSVNIEETRRKINESEQAKIKFAQEMNLDKPISDNRTQFGVFKMSREPMTEEFSAEMEHNDAKEYMLKVTPKKGGAKIAQGEDLDLVQQTLNIHLTAGKEPDLTNKLNSIPRYVEDPLPLQETIGFEEVDKYVHNQERLENRAFYDLQEYDKSLVEDIDISRIVKDERRDDFRNVVLFGPSDDSSNDHEMGLNPNFKATDTPEADHGNVDVNVESQEKIDKILHSYIPHAQRETILQATTASENEEQLTQKVEHIDETPLVEAQKPNIEGFNVTPRVLGDLDPRFSCFSSRQPDSFHPDKSSNVDVPASFDEVAKRCLDSPIGKIDEILLNEMEKIGIPVSCTNENQAQSPVIEDDLVQMEVIRRQPKDATEKQYAVAHEHEKSSIELFTAKNLYPSHVMNTEKVLPEQVEELEGVVLESVPDVIVEEEKYSMHPNQVLIYPYDKLSMSCDTEECTPSEKTGSNKKSSYFYVPTATQSEETENVDIAATSPFENPKIEEMTASFQSSPTRIHDAETQEVTSNVAADATTSEDTREDMLDTHILASHLRDPNIRDMTSKLLADITPLDSPTMLGNSKSPTDPKMMELEQKMEAEKAAEALKREEPPAEILGQTPSFDPPRLRATGLSSDEKPKPEYRYAQKNYDKETDKPSYEGTMNEPNTMWNQQYYQQKADNRYPQRMYAKGLDRQSSYYQAMPNVWNNQQPQPKSEEKDTQKTYVQKSYAKANEKSSPYYPVTASNKTWNDQNYLQQGYKYGNNMYGTGTESNSFYARNMSAAYMWGNQQTSPDSRTTGQMQENYARGTDEASNQPRAQSSMKEDRVEPKQTSSAYVNIPYASTPYQQTPYNNFCVPDGTWDKKTLLQPTVDKITAPLSSFNKTNINVSDDIWDEPAETITKTKKESTKVTLPDEILNQQLDPYYVLTCNETCPISPRPVVSACETSRFVGTTETIFEKDIKDAEPVISPEDTGLLIEFDRNKKQAKEAQMQQFTRFKPANIPEALNSLPNLSENVALSELLRRVRERSRIIECRNELKALGLEVEPAQGKCGRKAPRCPPTAPRSPPNNPVPPPSFGLPSLKRRPPACKPKKPRTRKCSTCELDVSGLHLGPKINAHTTEVCPEMVCEMNDSGAGVCAIRSKADLTEEVIDRLQTLGRMLGGVLRQGKSHVVDVGCLVRNRRGSKTLLARDYEPWSPIPSWPDPKKPERKSPPCTPGCKIFPPPRVCAHPDPPCDLKPCEGFPKKAFSLIDCFAVSLGENKVYDLGEF